MRLVSRILLAVILLAVTVPAFGQRRPQPAPAPRPGDVVKTSSFDSTIQYRACDPVVTGGPDRRVWTRPGSNPMVPPDLLMKAGLNGRSTRDFQRAVGGPTPGENISNDERVALGLVNQIIHDNFVSLPGHTEDQWRKYQNLVANDQNVQVQDYTCGEKIEYMLFGATPVGSKLAYQSASDQYVAHTGSKRWRVWMNNGDKGEYIDVAWECFNLASNSAPLKPTPVETITSVVPTAPAPPAPGLFIPKSINPPQHQEQHQEVNVSGGCGKWCKIGIIAGIATVGVVCAFECRHDRTTVNVYNNSNTAAAPSTTPTPDTTKTPVPLPNRPAGATSSGFAIRF